jgi:poly-gamma-glutamate system protein
MLTRAGAKEGEAVAIGFSGSFPALNLAAWTAAEALKLKVVAITGVTASTWGANIPGFTWLDMERVLFENGIISRRSVVASAGGLDDKAVRISNRGQKVIESTIKRNKMKALEAETFKENIDKRIAIYQSFSEGRRIAAYINVGGGTVSVGTKVGKKLYNPGLNLKPLRPSMKKVDSVMTRFSQENIPLIHMVFIDRLAEKYGLPTSPSVTQEVGEGRIFVHFEYNYYLVMGCLFGLLFISYLFLRKDIGYRIFGTSKAPYTPKPPEPMV